MSEHREPIPSMIYNATVGGHVTNSQQIIDENENKEQSQINAEVKENLGTGASVDTRIGNAKSEILGNVSSDYNTLEKLEDKLKEEVSDRNTQNYTKDETYNKEELNNLITTPSQKYISATATSETTNVEELLPITGEADTTYRVGNWDGTQYNDSVFSEYAWNGSAYIKLSTKSQVGEVYDISANHADTKYANLTEALGTNGANVPVGIRKGGMSIKFVKSPGNEYVQYRLMAQTFSIAESDWQGVDDEPVAGSKNLVESGSVWIAAKEIDGLENLFDESLKGYITTNVGIGNTVDVNTVLQGSSYYYDIIPCKLDEVFVIKGKGGFSPRLWCFTDSNYKVVSVAEDNKDTSASPEEIVTPSDGYLIINSNYSGTVLTRYRYVEKRGFNILKEKVEVIDEKVNEIYGIIEFDNKGYYYEYENNALTLMRNISYDCTLINVSDFRDNKITMISDRITYPSSLKSVMFIDENNNLISDIPVIGALNCRIDIPKNATKVALNANKNLNAKFLWGYRRNVKSVKYTETLNCTANKTWSYNSNVIYIIDARNIKITKSNTIIGDINFGYSNSTVKGRKVNGLTSSIRKSYNNSIKYGASNETDNDITDIVTIEIDNDAPEDMLITNTSNLIGESAIATGKHLIWGVVGISENVTFDMADIEFFDMDSKIVNNGHTISGVLANNYIDSENWGDTYNDTFALQIANIKVSRDIVLNSPLIITTDRDIDFCDHSVTIKKDDDINTQRTPISNAAVLLNQRTFHLFQRIENLTINCNYYYTLGLWFGRGRQVIFENIKINDCIFTGFCAGIPNQYRKLLDLSSYTINGMPGPDNSGASYMGSVYVNNIFCTNNLINGMIRTGYNVSHVIPNSHGFYLTAADSVYYNIGCNNFQCGTRGGSIIFNFHPWVSADEWLFENDGTEENPHYPIQDICGIEIRYDLGNNISLYYPQFDGMYNPIKIYLQNTGKAPNITINDGIWYLSSKYDDRLGLDFNLVSIVEPKETSYVPFNAYILRGMIKNNRDDDRLHLCDNNNFPNAVADFKMVQSNSYVKVALSGIVTVPSGVTMPELFVLHMVDSETGWNDIEVQISNGQYSTNVVLGEDYTIVCDGFTPDVEYINIEEPTDDCDIVLTPIV